MARLCKCHGEPMAWRSYKGGNWRCRVNVRNAGRQFYATGGQARMYANQIKRGDQIKNAPCHHIGMAELKSQMGDPRPEGMTLSRINDDGPSVYLGYDYRRGRRINYRLSTNPKDYVWESTAENLARK